MLDLCPAPVAPDAPAPADAGVLEDAAAPADAGVSDLPAPPTSAVTTVMPTPVGPTDPSTLPVEPDPTAVCPVAKPDISEGSDPAASGGAPATTTCGADCESCPHLAQ